jgi:hypothetical protein
LAYEAYPEDYQGPKEEDRSELIYPQMGKSNKKKELKPIYVDEYA